MIISKETFFEILDYLHDNDKFADDFDVLLRKSNKTTDFLDSQMFIDVELVNYVIMLLQNEFEDTEEGWISYWIYELNYGKDWQPGQIFRDDNTEIKLQTKEDLYNFLIDNLIIKYKRGTD